MAGMISFRLGGDHLQRLDALSARLGVNRAQLIRHLLSGDSILVDMIAIKAKTLNQVTLDEVIVRNNKNYQQEKEGLPELITIRLDSEFVQRLDALSASLGVNRVQVLRNLLSGDSTLVDAIAIKAKTLNQSNGKPRSVKPSKVIKEEKQSSEPKERQRELLEPLDDDKQPSKTPGDNAQTSEPLESDNLSPEVLEGDKKPSCKLKRNTKKSKVANESVDHSEDRRQIIEHLNQKTGKNFGYDTKDAIKAIDKMLDMGHPVDDFKKIIDNMTPLWIDSLEMNVRLNPETLFRLSNFEKYLNSDGANLSKVGPNALRRTNPSGDKYEKFYL